MHQNQLTIDNEQTATSDSFLQRIIPRFILFYSIIALILATSIYWVFHNYTVNFEKKLLLHEEVFITSTVQTLQTEMQSQLMIMQMVTRAKVLNDFLETGTQESQDTLIKLFTNLSVTFNRYDQIRLIGLNGKEEIRVNYVDGRPHVVPENQLQNKIQSNYIQASQELQAGEVYVSPIELNREHGEVEVPYKPVIRFITPISNSDNISIGYLVINYLASDLLNNFREQMELRIEGQGMLIGPEGYWISNHDRSNEWGNSLPNVNQKFENLYPSAWPQIKDSENGTFRTKKGIFRYTSIKPFNLTDINEYKKREDNELMVIHDSTVINDWKLVIFLPKGVVEEGSFFYKPVGRVILTSLFIASAVILLLILIMSEQKRRKRRYDLVIKDQLTDLYENAPCGYHSLDENGIILKINKTELDWLGYSKEEVLGKNFTLFLTQKSRGVFKTFLKQLKINKKIEGVVLEVQCKNKRTFFVSTSATSMSEKGHFSVARASSFDITDRTTLENKLAYIANTDELTQLSNRRHFFTQADEYFESSNNIVLLMVDADHFKHVNDNYGHDIGDQILKMMANTMRSSLPKSAIIARLGGEEFVVLLSGLSLEMASAAAEQLCVDMENSYIMLPDSDTKIQITVSIGLAARLTKDELIDDVLKRSDEALYNAKSTGRNKVIVSNFVKLN